MSWTLVLHRPVKLDSLELALPGSVQREGSPTPEIVRTFGDAGSLTNEHASLHDMPWGRRVSSLVPWLCVEPA